MSETIRMKFNGREIEAEVAGEILQIHPENGQPVQYAPKAYFCIMGPMIRPPISIETSVSRV